MKQIISILFVLLLTACDSRPLITERTSEYGVLPAGLSDCKVYFMISPTSARDLYVMRCPNSSTSTTSKSNAKNSRNETNVVIDGVEYVVKK